MKRRSRAREVALQLLYEYDREREVLPERVQQFLRDRLRDPELEAFAQRLFSGVIKHRREIDGRLAEVAENWTVERMATVDRNILRLGALELLHPVDTPPRVAIDEAVELAKRYGSADSPAFVNGVLDRVAAGKEKKEEAGGKDAPPHPPAP